MLFSFVHFAFYQIESALPTLARPIMSLDANEDAIVGALKQSLVILIMSMMQWILKMNSLIKHIFHILTKLCTGVYEV